MTEKILKLGKKTGSVEGNGDKRPETQEERAKRRRFEVIRNNHNVAIKALRVEALISQTEAQSNLSLLSNPQIQNELNSLPEKFRRGFQNAIRNYEEIMSNLRVCERKMEILADIKKSFNGVMTPERWGELIFYGITGKQPKGKVRFRRQEAYFVMTFSNLSDYAAIHLGGKEKEENLRWANKSGGSYYSSMPLDLIKGTAPVPVLLIRAEEWRDLGMVRMVELHERQHFINDKVFNLFYTFESHPSFTSSRGRDEEKESQYWELKEKFCIIKDEILAFIRGGSSGEFLKSSLLGELYADLFSSLPLQEEEKAKKVINILAAFLERNHSFLNNPEARAILVYQLVSVPLEEFPKWLDAFEEYYGERLKVFDRFFRIKLFSGLFSLQDFSDLIKRSFPSVIEDELKSRGVYTEGLRTLNELSLIEKEARDILYDQQVSFGRAFSRCKELGERYAQLCARLEDLYKPLFRESVCVPNAGHARTYGFGEEDYYAERSSQLTPSMIKIRQAILDAVFGFPQESINLIAAYLRGEFETEPEELRKLASLVKKTVHSLNRSKACCLDFGVEEEEPPSFWMEVRYVAPPEDNELGIEGVKIPVSFYSN